MLLSLIAQVLAIGEDCQNSLSRWDKAYCEIINQPQKYQEKCTSQRRFPVNGTNYENLRDVKGLIVMYHGFTACPDAFDAITEQLNREGYVTLTPLIPGQGIKLGFGCEKPNTCITQQTNPSFMPVNKKPYMDWVDWTLDMVREESSLIPIGAKTPDFFIGALGLSAGGPLGQYAVSRPNTPITKFLTVNPFFSFTFTPLDFKVEICKSSTDPEKCVLANAAPTTSMINSTDSSPKDAINSAANPLGSLGQILQTVQRVSKGVQDFLIEETLGELLANNYDVFMTKLWSSLTSIGENSWLMNNPIVNNPFGWGPLCEQNTARGGVCNFRIKNVIALQAFAEYSMAQLDRIPTSVKYAVIHSDFDGPARDSVSSAVVNRLQSRGLIASKCRYELRCPPEQIDFTNNVCGVPHSSFSRAEALYVPPQQLYWEENLFQNIKDFFNGQTASVGFFGEPKGSFCIPTSGTVGFGPQFDNMGAKYIQNAMRRFK
jgi:hypothetical protein